MRDGRNRYEIRGAVLHDGMALSIDNQLIYIIMKKVTIPQEVLNDVVNNLKECNKAISMLCELLLSEEDSSEETK